MAYNNNFTPGGPLSCLEQETQARNVIIRYYQTHKDYEKIINEQGLHQEVIACQQALAIQQMRNIDFTPQLNLQENIVALLPLSLQPVVLYLSQETQFDHLTCTMAVLSAISTAMCGRFRIVLKPSWTEAVLLYSMLVAESGLAKDSLINMVKAPLAEVMEDMQRGYDSSLPKRKLEMKIQKKVLDLRLNADSKAISKACANDYSLLMEEALKLSEQAAPSREELESKELEARPNLFLSDSTEKGLIDGLKGQGGHQAAIEPEPGFIQKIVGLGPRFNIDLLLKAYDQSDHTVITSGKQTNLIRPSLNLFYCAQPEIASKFFNGISNERGLAPRFMPSFAYKVGNNRQYDYSHQFQVFAPRVKSILKYCFILNKRREIYDLALTSMSLTRLEIFQTQNQNQIQNGYEHMAAFLRKLHGKACRIAGALHIWDCFINGGIPLTIGDQAIEAGIGIARALIPHADYAFNPSGLAGVDPAWRIYNWFRTTGRLYSSHNDIRQNTFEGVKNPQFNGGLQRLLQTNHLGKIHDHNGKPVYVVHPNINGWFNPPPVPPLVLPPTTPQLPPDLGPEISPGSYL